MGTQVLVDEMQNSIQVKSFPYTPSDLIAWGNADSHVFWIYRKKKGWDYKDFKIDENTPLYIVQLYEQVQIDFPGAQFQVGKPHPKPPVKIPWKQISAVVTTVATAIAYLAAAIVAMWVIASLGTIILAVLALGAIAAADPVLLVYFPDTEETVCVAVWYD